MHPVLIVPALALMQAQPSPATPKEEIKMTRAHGSFDVNVNPLAGDDAAWGGFSRLSIDKQFRGELEGTSRGQMVAAGTEVKGSAGYVALERVTGTLKGRSGSFILQHSGTMARGAAHMTVTVVPDSGTGQLVGLAGTMTILIEGGKHTYDFEFTLP